MIPPEQMIATEPPEPASPGAAAPQAATGIARAPAQARMVRILERLNEGGSVTVTDLAHEFGVSDMTVRRDLAELERDGLLERVHGGAIGLSRGPLTVIDDIEPAFEARARQNADRKARIALAAARHVAGRNALAFDLGTTVLAAARAVAAAGPQPQMRVFTNSMRAGQAMARAGLSVYMSGGLIRAEEMSLTGTEAVDGFSRYYFDVALLGASGMTAEGVFDYSPEEAAVKTVFLQRSAERVLLLDSTKFRRVSTVLIASLAELSTLITDAPPPPDLASVLDGAGVRVILA
ncbi:DeoR/GlpR family DNA-binding transcription regulator [Pseudomonas sp. GX19020]|uniref:DeoR/GlpR family DNA-binding transcription regulator n=1 Tax=Pseudomonadota TaxID=1224 RepID=UPI0008995657|nr:MULTISPECIES: DeoR/GlpR family DNA-binding transcription regulator [Pseudomonadota]MCL4067996.1 DeoR/GlpR family DNA-binding transcription regulator [Pseudomonas sp. GX19020]SED74721.1 transcriptional regulator, DeoR family [Rhodobacter sp. 24-YEA-8]